MFVENAAVSRLHIKKLVKMINNQIGTVQVGNMGDPQNSINSTNGNAHIRDPILVVVHC